MAFEDVASVGPIQIRDGRAVEIEEDRRRFGQRRNGLHDVARTVLLDLVQQLTAHPAEIGDVEHPADVFERVVGGVEGGLAQVLEIRRGDVDRVL